MSNYFDKFCNEGNAFINKLNDRLGHPGESEKSIRLLKAVLHSIRDRVTMGEAHHIMAQLPFALKALYADQWHVREKLLNYSDMEGFKNCVKEFQKHYGEANFNWEQSTEQLVKEVLNQLKEDYFSEGQIDHILEQLPGEVRQHLKRSA
jgi:uncharacterized protein (DUF2267 family)